MAYYIKKTSLLMLPFRYLYYHKHIYNIHIGLADFIVMSQSTLRAPQRTEIDLVFATWKLMGGVAEHG